MEKLKPATPSTNRNNKYAVVDIPDYDPSTTNRNKYAVVDIPDYDPSTNSNTNRNRNNKYAVVDIPDYKPPTPSTNSNTKYAVVDIPDYDYSSDVGFGQGYDVMDHHHSSSRRSNLVLPLGIKIDFCSLAIVLVVMMCLVGYGWVFFYCRQYDVNRPQFSIQLNCSTTTITGLMTKCDIDLYVNNPNKNTPLSYNNLRISLSAQDGNGDMFAAGTGIPPLSQGPKQTTLLHETLSYLGGGMVYKIKLETDWQTGTKPFPRKNKMTNGRFRDFVCVNQIRLTPNEESAPTSSSSSSLNEESPPTSTSTRRSLLQPIDCGYYSPDRYATFP